MAKTKKRQSKKQAQGADILASAHNIWLAGLGAVAAAGEEGERLFKALAEHQDAGGVLVQPKVDGLSIALVTVQRRLSTGMREDIEKQLVAANQEIGNELQQIKADIDTVKEMVDLLKRTSWQSGFGGAIDRRLVALNLHPVAEVAVVFVERIHHGRIMP